MERTGRLLGEEGLAPLAESPPIEGVLERGFRTNPEVEQRYFAWEAALARVTQATALPQPRFSYELLFSRERIRSWDRTTLGLEQMIPLPQRRSREGKMAFAEAQAAGRMLEEAKFGVQAELIEAWQELWMIDRRIAIEEENLELLRQFATVTRQRVAVGRAMQADASKADLETAAAENQLASLAAQRKAALGRINALLSRPVDAPLRAREPAYREPLRVRDDQVLRWAAERNPELGALAFEVQGRENALELARLAYIPDLELSFDMTGSMERMVESMVELPMNLSRIRAGIDGARADLRAARAELRGRRNQVGAEVVLQLYLARDSERQLAVYREQLLPRARDVLHTIESSYATGGASFLELLDAQRSLLELEQMAVELEGTRGIAIGELEKLCALDFGATGSEKEPAP
jgi:outer membrane protein TolC